MSHITKEEYLSAFLDGESGSFEQQRLSDQLGTDDLMQDKLSSFALIGESMRNQAQPAIIGSSFLAGIQDAIVDDECTVNSSLGMPSEQVSEVIDKKRFIPRQALGYAVAASFAAVAAVSLQNYLAPVSVDVMVAEAELTNERQAASTDVAVMAAAMVSTSQPATQAVSYSVPDAKTRGLLNQYVAHHFQYASTNTMMPRVRAVSYSTDF